MIVNYLSTCLWWCSCTATLLDSLLPAPECRFMFSCRQLGCSGTATNWIEVAVVVHLLRWIYQSHLLLLLLLLLVVAHKSASLYYLGSTYTKPNELVRPFTVINTTRHSYCRCSGSGVVAVRDRRQEMESKVMFSFSEYSVLKPRG